MSRRTVAAVVAAVLAVPIAVGAGLAAGRLPGHHPVPERITSDQAQVAAAAQEPPGDRVQAAVDGVRETGFYIGPELRDQLSEETVAEVEGLIADARVPLFVVWWEDTADGGYNTPYAALDQLRAGVATDGYYAVVSPGGHPLLGAVGYADPFIDADSKGRPDAAVTRIVAELAEEPPDPLVVPGPESDYWGGAGGGITAGLIFAVLTYVGLLLAAAALSVVLRRPHPGDR
ncbi:MAG: hypothetical protein WBP61_18175 [Nocardioides sp.]